MWRGSDGMMHLDVLRTRGKCMLPPCPLGKRTLPGLRGCGDALKTRDVAVRKWQTYGSEMARDCFKWQLTRVATGKVPRFVHCGSNDAVDGDSAKQMSVRNTVS